MSNPKAGILGSPMFTDVKEFTCEGGNPVANEGDACEETTCQACCPHYERDHGICLDCGHEQCLGELIDAADWAFNER